MEEAYSMLHTQMQVSTGTDVITLPFNEIIHDRNTHSATLIQGSVQYQQGYIQFYST